MSTLMNINLLLGKARRKHYKPRFCFLVWPNVFCCGRNLMNILRTSHLHPRHSAPAEVDIIMRGFCFGPPISLRAASCYANGYLNIPFLSQGLWLNANKRCHAKFQRDVSVWHVEVLKFVIQKYSFTFVV